MENKYLNEENYNKVKNKIRNISIVVFVVGLLIAGTLFFFGIKKFIAADKSNETNEKVDVNTLIADKEKEIKYKYDLLKDNYNKTIKSEKDKLVKLKKELKAKGIEYHGKPSYDAGDKYTLYIITNVLNPSFDWCDFDEYKENEYTAKYCSVKKSIEKVDYDYKKELETEIAKIKVDNTLDDVPSIFKKAAAVPFFFVGGFILFSTFIVSLVLFVISKRREIAAFGTQQYMPIAKEGIEEITPTVSNSVESLTRSIKKGLSHDKPDDDEYDDPFKNVRKKF